MNTLVSATSQIVNVQIKKKLKKKYLFKNT